MPFEGYRLCRGAVRLLRRHAAAPIIPSCSPTIRAMRARAEALAAKTHELIGFLVDVLRRDRVDGALRGHGHLSRFLLGPARARRQGAAARAARAASRASSSRAAGSRGLLRLRRHVLRQISRRSPTASSTRRPSDIAATGADTLLAGDLGCLLNMAGKLTRAGQRQVKARHVAEVLAGMTDEPGRSARRSEADAADRTPLDVQGRTRQRRWPMPSCRRRWPGCDDTFIAGARSAVERLPEFEALRDAAATSRTTRSAHLDFYLEPYERQGRGGRRQGALVRATPTRRAPSCSRSAGASAPGPSPRASR